MVPVAYYLILAAILFCIGIAAFLIKRNIITIFMSIELMLNAVNLTFVAFARTDFRIFCDGRRRCRSGCRPRHHYCALSRPADLERRSGQPYEELR